MPKLKLADVSCPICGSEEFREVLTTADVLHDVPGLFRLVECTSCDHAYMNPQPTRESLALCYPADYGCHTSEDDGEEFASSDASTDPPSPSFLIRALKTIPGLRSLYHYAADKKSEIIPAPTGSGRALEIGCGRGDFLVRLCDAGWAVTGVDVTPRSVEICRARGFDTELGTLEEQTFPANSFDAVFGWMVLEHTATPGSVVGEVARVLRPGGKFAFSVPDYGALERRFFGKYWLGLELPRHLQQFRVKTLQKLLVANGFEVEQIVWQQSAFYLVGSFGLWLRDRPFTNRLGVKLIDFVDSPTMFGELSIAPLAKMLSWIRQSGRVTVVARRVAVEGQGS